MSLHFYSHGKLLLSGEYLVLDGVWGMALPTRRGQRLQISHDTPGFTGLRWTSEDANGVSWFTASFEFPGFSINTCNDTTVATRLQELLLAAQALNRDFLSDSEGLIATAILEFPRDWGLGSSSTLITNLARWAKVDPYALLERTFGGSGYDIACAQSKQPLLYRRGERGPETRELRFSPAFSNKLWFVHLNRKQDSRDGIRRYRENLPVESSLRERINKISLELADSEDLNSFSRLLEEHEEIIARVLGGGMQTVGKRLFPDFKGVTKSLGAWGGDFILATGEADYVPSYFNQKGYTTIIPYEEMVLPIPN